VLARKAGVDVDALRTTSVERKWLPFESIRKRMSSAYSLFVGEAYIFAKGAPRELLDLCSHIQLEGGVRELTATNCAAIYRQIDEFANDGLRILGFAYRGIGSGEIETLSAEQAERDLVFLGITAMYDPPRPGVAEAVESC